MIEVTDEMLDAMAEYIGTNDNAYLRAAILTLAPLIEAQARAEAIEDAAALADISVSALEAARRIRALASRPVSEREGADTAPAPAISGGETVSVPREVIDALLTAWAFPGTSLEASFRELKPAIDALRRAALAAADRSAS